MHLPSAADRANAPRTFGGGPLPGELTHSPSSEPPTSHADNQASSSPPTTSSIDQTFTVFPRLPIELRLKIWRYTFQPRVLTITELDVDGRDYWTCERERFAGRSVDIYCKSTCPVPVALQVCQESRGEALRAYQLSFGTDNHPAIIYFNPDLDIVYPILHFVDEIDARVDPDSLARIRSLCFTFDILGDDSVGISTRLKLSELKGHLNRFSALKQLYLAIDSGYNNAPHAIHLDDVVLEDVECLVPEDLGNKYGLYGIAEEEGRLLLEDTKPRPEWPAPIKLVSAVSAKALYCEHF